MAEDKDFSIVDSAESLKTIDKEPKINPPKKAPKIEEPKLRPRNYDVLPGSYSAKDNVSRDRDYHVGLDPTKYENEYNKGNVV